MKNNPVTKHAWVAACCGFILLCGLGVAQDAHPRKASAVVPFDFYISGNRLPAGQYTLDMVAPTYVLLQSSDGKVRQDLYFMQVAAPEATPPSKIVFVRRDGAYYLSEVWGWFGKAQLTSFTSRAGDKTKEVALTPAEEKEIAKPPAGL